METICPFCADTGGKSCRIHNKETDKVMVSFSRKEIIQKRVRYGIATGEVGGEFQKLYKLAWHDYARRMNYDPRDMLPDDWCTIHARDDEVIIEFTVEETVKDG